MGDLVLVSLAVFCVSGTIVALALFSGARGPTPPVPTRTGALAEDDAAVVEQV